MEVTLRPPTILAEFRPLTLGEQFRLGLLPKLSLFAQLDYSRGHMGLISFAYQCAQNNRDGSMTEDTTVSPELEFDATHPIYTNKRKTEVPGTVLSCAADNCGCSTHFFSLPRLVSRLLPEPPRIPPNQFVRPALGSQISNNVFLGRKYEAL